MRDALQPSAELREASRALPARPVRTSPTGPGPGFRISLALAVMALFGVRTLAAATAPPAPAPNHPAPREETALPEAHEGETETPEATFAPMEIPSKALQFKDPAIAALAARIADGSADLRERRAWHELSLLYSPFDQLPPAGWR